MEREREREGEGGRGQKAAKKHGLVAFFLTDVKKSNGCRRTCGKSVVEREWQFPGMEVASNKIKLVSPHFGV